MKYSLKPIVFFNLTMLAASGLIAHSAPPDKVNPTEVPTPADVKIITAQIRSTQELSQQASASSGQETFSQVRSAYLAKVLTPITVHRSVHFRLLHPFRSTSTADNEPAYKIQGMSTRAWASPVGWHTGESGFAEDMNREVNFGLLYAGADTSP